MKATVSEKGQVTIPKAVRTKLGIHPGTVLEFEEKDGTLVVVKSSESGDPVVAVTGVISQKIDVDAYLQETRGSAK